MIDYVIFFGMVVMAIVLFVLYEKKPKEKITADPEKYKCESPIERRLYDALKANGEYVRTQVPCGRYSIDIALPTFHIAIECDGAAYHSSNKQKAHDRRKDSYLRANGWKVIRFTGSQIYKDLNGILRRIEKEKGNAHV